MLVNIIVKTTMNKNKKKTIKIISMLIILSFLASNDLFALEKISMESTRESLQVETPFKPLTDTVGKEYDAQIRIEAALIMAMLAKGSSVYKINMELEKAYSLFNNAAETRKNRLFEVLAPPIEETAKKIFYIKIRYGKAKGTVYRISSNYKNIDQIRQDRIHKEKNNSIKVQKLEPEDIFFLENPYTVNAPYQLYSLRRTCYRERKEIVEKEGSSVEIDPVTGRKIIYSEGRQLKPLDGEVFFLEDQQWQIPSAIKLPPNVKEILNTGNGALIITTGPFYEEKYRKVILPIRRDPVLKELTDEEVYKRFGLKRVYDYRGEKFTLPVLTSGGKTIVVPLKYEIILEKKGQGVIFAEKSSEFTNKDLLTKKVFGIEFKNVGTTAYSGHNKGGPFPPTVFKKYIGRAGIFLDWEYDVNQREPIGLSFMQRSSIPLERELMRVNASLTRWTVADIEMGEKYQISLRVPVGDYRRLAGFFKNEKTPDRALFEAIVKEKGMSPAEYLRIFAKSYGENFRKYLQAGIIQPAHGSLINSDINGSGTDFEDYLTIKDLSREEMKRYASDWINNFYKIVDLEEIDENTRNDIVLDFFASFYSISKQTLQTKKTDKGSIDLARLQEEMIDFILERSYLVPRDNQDPSKGTKKTVTGEDIEQIGKKAFVRKIIRTNEKDKLEAIVKDVQGKEKSIFLVKRKDRPLDWLKQDIKGDKKILKSTGAFLRKIITVAEENNVQVYLFQETLKDLLGFSVPAEDIIAVHEKIKNDPVALFHEIMGYLLKKKVISLELQGQNLYLKTEKGTYLFDAADMLENLRGEKEHWAFWQDKQINRSGHYLLRLLQRIVFGDADKELTFKIHAIISSNKKIEIGKETKVIDRTVNGSVSPEILNVERVIGPNRGMFVKIDVMDKKKVELDEVTLEISNGRKLREEDISVLLNTVDARAKILLNKILRTIPKFIEIYPIDGNEHNLIDIVYVPKKINPQKVELIAGREEIVDDPYYKIYLVLLADLERKTKNVFLGEQFDLELREKKLFVNIKGTIFMISAGKAINSLLAQGMDWADLPDSVLNLKRNKKYLVRLLCRVFFEEKDTELWEKRKILFKEKNPEKKEIVRNTDVYFLTELDEIIKEITPDLYMNSERKERLERFYKRYQEHQRGLLDARPPAALKYLSVCFNARRIADMFYLYEKYSFNVLDLLGSKRKTFWEKEGRLYKFTVKGRSRVRLEKIDKRGGKEAVGEATNTGYDRFGFSEKAPEDPFYGLNLGNFLIKTHNYLLWAHEHRHNFVIDVLTSGGDKLIEYYRTIGFIVPDPEKRLAERKLFGGIDAGILLGREKKEIEKVSPYIWRQWSQRYLDRFLRLKNSRNRNFSEKTYEVFNEYIKTLTIQERRGLLPAEVIRALEDIERARDDHNIGKQTLLFLVQKEGRDRGRIIVQKSTGEVVSFYGEKRDFNEIKKTFTRLETKTSGDKKAILDILKLLEKSPPDIYCYETLPEDLFGKAIYANGTICLHKSIINSPAAVFHEMLEYLFSGDNNKLKITFKGRFAKFLYYSGFYGILKKIKCVPGTIKGQIILTDIRESKEIIKVSLNKESQAIALKAPGNPHYLIRAMQRELFPRQDRDLSGKILFEKNKKNLIRTLTEHKVPEAGKKESLSLIESFLMQEGGSEEVLGALFAIILQTIAHARILAEDMLFVEDKEPDFLRSGNYIFRGILADMSSGKVDRNLFSPKRLLPIIQQAGEYRSAAILRILHILAVNNAGEDILERNKIISLAGEILDIYGNLFHKRSIAHSINYLETFVKKDMVTKKVLNIDFLSEIISKAGSNTPQILWVIKELAETGNITEKEFDLFKAFIDMLLVLNKGKKMRTELCEFLSSVARKGLLKKSGYVMTGAFVKKVMEGENAGRYEKDLFLLLNTMTELGIVKQTNLPEVMKIIKEIINKEPEQAKAIFTGINNYLQNAGAKSVPAELISPDFLQMLLEREENTLYVLSIMEELIQENVISEEKASDFRGWVEKCIPFEKNVIRTFLEMTSIKRKEYLGKRETIINSILQGRAGKKDILHSLAGYELIVAEFLNKGKDISLLPGFDLYKSVMEGAKTKYDIFTEKEKAEILYSAYESLKLRNFLFMLKKQADRLGRPFVVIENLNFGKLHSFVIEEELISEGVKIIEANARSTYAHNHPEAVHGKAAEDDIFLLSEPDLEFIVKKEPIVAVIDGSASLDEDPFSEQNGHFADTYQIYRNYFHAISRYPDDKKFGLGGIKTSSGTSFANILLENKAYKKLKALSRRIRRNGPDYSMFLWYPGRRELDIRHRREPIKVPESMKLYNAHDPEQPYLRKISGPSLVFINANMQDEMIPEKIRQINLSGKKKSGAQYHNSGFFDDRNWQNRYSIVMKGAGPAICNAFKDLYEEEYEKLKKEYSYENGGDLKADKHNQADLSAGDLYERLSADLKDDIVFQEETKIQMRKYVEKYLAVFRYFVSPSSDGNNKSGGESIDINRIAELFYLYHKYSFDILELYSEGRTYWGNKNKGMSFLVEYSPANGHMITIKENGSSLKEKISAASAKTNFYEHFDKEKNKGRNIGNFAMKVHHWMLWMEEKQTSEVVNLTRRGNTKKLAEYYESAGGQVSWDDKEHASVKMTFYGGIKAGILTSEQSKEIRALDPRIWRVWSQREIDRFFRITEKTLRENLINGCNEFSMVNKNMDIKELRRLTPEIVSEYIINYSLLAEEEGIQATEKNSGAFDPKNLIKYPLPNTKIIIEKHIEQTNHASVGILKALGSFIRKYDLTGKNVPVDIVVDLSLIPAEDEDNNFESWAHLILLARDMKNVNFLFERPTIQSRAFLKKDLLEEIERAPTEKDAEIKIKEKVKEKILQLNLEKEINFEAFCKERLFTKRREDAVEIPIISKVWLKWHEELSLIDPAIEVLQENQFPVAMEDISFIKDKGVLLRNFEAALSIGLIKAYIAILKRKDKQLKKEHLTEIMSRLQGLYDIFSEIKPELGQIQVDEFFINNMVSDYGAVRLEHAIKMALPPITRMLVEELKEYHNIIQTVLFSA